MGWNQNRKTRYQELKGTTPKKDEAMKSEKKSKKKTTKKSKKKK